jgi:endonuclease/exonuclease/phosphatase (EEP) superfamily protein YafD
VRLTPELRRNALAALAVAAPWSWFVLRDHLGQLGDLVAVALPLLAVGAVVALAVLGLLVRRRVRARWFLAGATSVVLVATVAIVGPRWPDDVGEPVDPVRVVAANVLYRNDDIVAGTAALVARDADVLVVTEVTGPFVRALGERYPYVETDCGGPFCTGGTGVFSRFPLNEVDDVDIGAGTLRMVVDAPTPFVLYASHLNRPALRTASDELVSFGTQHEQVHALAARVVAEAGPVVVAGDLNLSDRTRGYRELDDAMVDAARTGWVGSTFPFGVFKPLLLRIDHVFVSSGWCSDDAADFAVPGSDHRGVAASVGPCA